MKPFAQFVQRLHGRTLTEKLAIIDDKMRRLKAEGRGKKKLKRLAALREFIQSAAIISNKMPATPARAPAASFGALSRIRF